MAHDAHAQAADHGQIHVHVTSLRLLIGIFLALMVLTALTYGVALINLGPLNIWVALAVGLVITHADRGFIEEVHHGSTPAEAARVWWDIAWVWGPPDDHLAHLLATMGPARFLFGSGQPLRLAETPGARLDLLSLSPADLAAITLENAASLERRRSPNG